MRRILAVFRVDNMRFNSYHKGRQGRPLYRRFMYKIEFFECRDGSCPVAIFLDSLRNQARAKVVSFMDILTEKGIEMRRPYTAHLEDGIFELRCSQGESNIRCLFFFYYNKQIVVTNGFLKKTDKVPRKEIKLAKKYRAEWLERHGGKNSEELL